MTSKPADAYVEVTTGNKTHQKQNQKGDGRVALPLTESGNNESRASFFRQIEESKFKDHHHVAPRRECPEH